MRCLAVLLLTLVAMPALAQDDMAIADRLERLERDISFVQKQVYRGGGTEAGTHSTGGGNVQVRFTQIDEEIRQIRGAIEQIQFQNRQHALELKKLVEDVDYRLRALEQRQSEAAAAAPPAAMVAPVPLAAGEPLSTPAFNPDAMPGDEKKPATFKPESKEKPALAGQDTSDANTHYSQALKLLNDKKYSESGASFDAFVKKYPNDTLVSNAYYWLGESQYIRKDYTRSAESFRKGFEANAEGQKAPDNLYKLALSLHQVKRTSDACTVLKKVIEKYGESAGRTVAKAHEAHSSLQCK